MLVNTVEIKQLIISSKMCFDVIPIKKSYFYGKFIWDPTWTP